MHVHRLDHLCGRIHFHSLEIYDNKSCTLADSIKASGDWMEAQFAEFKEQVKHRKEETAVKAVKHTRHEQSYSFRKEGNKEGTVGVQFQGGGDTAGGRGS